VITTRSAGAPPAVDDSRHAAAEHVYDAECALHAAHQAGIDAWVAAASEDLHAALVDHLKEGAP
jgi:hypothetical protein